MCGYDAEVDIFDQKYLS